MSASKNVAKSSAAKRTITIKLKKSKISCNPVQRATINGLGLRNLHQTRTLENTPSVRGMIKQVIHLVDVVSETR